MAALGKQFLLLMKHPPLSLIVKSGNILILNLFLKGDRMWQFGIGLFLVELEPESLQLVAIYGFISGAATLLLSTVIGDWVDRTARLKGKISVLFTIFTYIIRKV